MTRRTVGNDKRAVGNDGLPDAFVFVEIFSSIVSAGAKDTFCVEFLHIHRRRNISETCLQVICILNIHL